MGTVKQELTITIDDVVNAKDDAGLTRVLREAAEQCGYYTTLDVSFDYWHFGRHAEHAQHNGMLELAALFSAAWQVQYRVLMHSGRSKKVRDLVTQEQAAIRLEHEQRLQRGKLASQGMADGEKPPLAALGEVLSS
ncbi:hypothetical protein [Ottowia sp.]|uniref:hypothetical protein n=1 Tax=Ottowia sp. TaxID=1898956 RepID=UPI0025D26D81|nr:hypothetical protein [Ottowia sp.]MBK6616539.1 hypothetical protein [Ottowia sp.]